MCKEPFNLHAKQDNACRLQLALIQSYLSCHHQIAGSWMSPGVLIEVVVWLRQMAHCGFKWLKTAEKVQFNLFHKFFQADFRIFTQFLLYSLYIQNLSNSYGHEYDLSISRLLNTIFGGFLPFGPTMATGNEYLCVLIYYLQSSNSLSNG